MESYGEKDEEEGRESDGDEEVIKSTSGGPGDDRPFILFKEWTINDFLPTMSKKIFKNLCARFQFVFLESLKSVIQGRPQTLACMMPCSRQD